MIADFIKSLSASRAAVAQSLDVLDALREAVAAAKAEIGRIEAAPPPADEIMAGFDGWLDRAATEAVDALGINRLLARDTAAAGLELPFFLDRQGGSTVRDSSRATEIVMGLIIATNRQAFRAIIAGQVADLLVGQETMSAATRAKKLAAASAAVLEAEMAEEACVRALEASGLTIARRPDADPRAVLAADASLPG